jgi:hypothetical protein
MYKLAVPCRYEVNERRGSGRPDRALSPLQMFLIRCQNLAVVEMICNFLLVYHRHDKIQALTIPEGLWIINSDYYSEDRWVLRFAFLCFIPNFLPHVIQAYRRISL